MPSHDERIARVREAYRAAHERFMTRLRDASDADVHRQPPGGGWSAAQIGWHVAAVDGSFAAVLSGEVAAAKPLPDGAAAKPWAEIVAAMPERLEAGRRVQPPPDARRDDVLAALTASAAKLDAALAGLSEERGTGYAITHPVIGTVALGQVGEWATAHVIRHNAQAKRALAQASGR
jgi:DinB family protein